MKKFQPFLFLISLFTACCTPGGEAQTVARDAQTKALFTALISAIEHYEDEYRQPVELRSSAELADLIEGKNEREITFYRFKDEERIDAGEILDAYGNPIRVLTRDNGIWLFSDGSNGIMDSAPGSDDIVMQYAFRTPSQAGNDVSE